MEEIMAISNKNVLLLALSSAIFAPTLATYTREQYIADVEKLIAEYKPLDDIIFRNLFPYKGGTTTSREELIMTLDKMLDYHKRHLDMHIRYEESNDTNLYEIMNLGLTRLPY